MDIKRFILSFYQGTDDGMHIQRLTGSAEAEKPHSHEYFQIYYIARGKLTHITETDASLLCQGDAFIIPPNKVHYIQNSADATFYSFSFYEDMVLSPDRSPLAASFLQRLKSADSIRAKMTVPGESVFFFENIMQEMEREFRKKQIGAGETLRGCAAVLITHLARIYYDTMPEELTVSDARQMVLLCIEYIRENYTADLKLSEIAARSAMCKSNFCKLFTEITGMTFHQYVQQCRIHKATEYIRRGVKISAVYGLCGYNDLSTFYRNFRSVMGISPSEYRRRLDRGDK